MDGRVGAIDDVCSVCNSPVNVQLQLERPGCYGAIRADDVWPPLRNPCGIEGSQPVPAVVLAEMLTGSTALAGSLSVSATGPSPTFKSLIPYIPAAASLCQRGQSTSSNARVGTAAAADRPWRQHRPGMPHSPLAGQMGMYATAQAAAGGHGLLHEHTNGPSSSERSSESDGGFMADMEFEIADGTDSVADDACSADTVSWGA